jgi:hypothetical protein
MLRTSITKRKKKFNICFFEEAKFVIYINKNRGTSYKLYQDQLKDENQKYKLKKQAKQGT